MKIGRALTLIVLLATIPLLSQACDLCGCFTPQLETVPGAALDPLFPGSRGWYAALAEQFTRFGTLQFEGHEVANPTGQYENSFITQLVAGYELTSRFSLQVNVPIIYRDFKRPEGFAIDRGTESGLGDVSLLLRTVAYKYSSPGRREFNVDGKDPVAVEHDPDFTFSAVLLTGVKFPTGGTSRLTEEFHEIDVPGAPVSGIHGHDLTLGTGSYDGIFGVQASLRWKNFFFESNAQFTLRGSGAHQYDFANDFSWVAGPGYYLVRRPDCVVGLELLSDGETKDTDRFRGAPAEDTGMTEEYLGPRIVASCGRWSGEFAVEIPVIIDNTALQAVPDYRLRAGIAFRF
jgi:hypothetical protein